MLLKSTDQSNFLVSVINLKPVVLSDIRIYSFKKSP